MKDLSGWSRKRYKLLTLPVPRFEKLRELDLETAEDLGKLYDTVNETIPQMKEIIPSERFFVERAPNDHEHYVHTEHYYCDLDSEDILQLRIMGIDLP